VMILDISASNLGVISKNLNMLEFSPGSNTPSAWDFGQVPAICKLLAYRVVRHSLLATRLYWLLQPLWRIGVGSCRSTDADRGNIRGCMVHVDYVLVAEIRLYRHEVELGSCHRRRNVGSMECETRLHVFGNREMVKH